MYIYGNKLLKMRLRPAARTIRYHKYQADISEGYKETLNSRNPHENNLDRVCTAAPSLVAALIPLRNVC